MNTDAGSTQSNNRLHDTMATDSSQSLPPESTALLPGDRPDLRAEAPGADGIRWGLVEHIRKLIDSGRYDTPERWALAEERLFDRTDR